MNSHLWLGLINNAFWLLALFTIFDSDYFAARKGRLLSEIFHGALIAGICIAVMAFPVPLYKGIVFDTRTIIISTAALFFGAFPTVITAAGAMLFRLLSGGSGAPAGAVTILTSAALGLVWHRRMKHRKSRYRWLDILVMSLCVHALMIAEMLLLPAAYRLEVIRAILLPTLLLYPAISVFLGTLLYHRQDRLRYQQELSASEEKYRRIIDNVTDIVWSVSPDLKITYVSPSVYGLAGKTPSEYMAGTLEEKFPPDSLSRIREVLREERITEQDPDCDRYRSRTIEVEHYKADGTVAWLALHFSILRDENGTLSGFQGVTRDITEMKRGEMALADERNKARQYIDIVPVMFLILDREGKVSLINREGCSLLGLPESGILGQDWVGRFIPEKDREPLGSMVRAILQGEIGLFRTHENFIVGASGNERLISWHNALLRDDRGVITGILSSGIDITEQKKREEDLRYLSEHDPMTGLLNLWTFEKLFSGDTKKAAKPQGAVVLLGIRRFGALERIFGYRFVHLLIRDTALCLLDTVPKSRKIFHLPPGRFAIYLPHCKDRRELDVLCKKLEASLGSSIHPVLVSFVISALEIGKTDMREDAESILRKLAAAAEGASVHDRFSCRYFDEEIEHKQCREAAVSRALTNMLYASDDPSLFMLYQPIVDLRSGEIAGFEALARFADRELSEVPPSEFIPIAESSQLMLPLGRRILQLVCGFALRLRQEGFGSVTLSVNISAMQLLSESFLTDTESLILETGIDPAALHMEITESVFSENLQEFNDKLLQIRAMGIGIAIDDFGTGYSSLARVRELKIDFLKIDQYFIGKLSDIRPENAITGDIISMAHKLGYSVIAEGVETEEQKAYLSGHGCDRVQGNLLGRPSGADEALALLKKSNTSA